MCHFFAVIHGRILPITCLSGMFVLMLRIKLNSVEESVKEKEEDESHEERGEEGIRVICGHCFFYLCVECGRRIIDTGIFFRSLRGGLDLLL